MCGKRVFLMERLGAENHVFHRSCFHCSSCDVQLKPGSYEFDAQSDRFYCRTHYREILRHQTIKRTMDQRGITSFEEKSEESSPKKPRRKGKFSSPQPEVRSTASTPRELKADPGPTSGQLALSDSDLSRKGSEKVKAELPSLLKTLAAAKQQDSENTTFGVSISAGNSPISSPRANRKTKQAPSASKTETPPPPQPQPPRGTVVLGQPTEHPKAVPETKLPQKVVSAATEPHAEHPKAVPETKLPQKVVSAAKEPHAEHPKAVPETKLPQKVVSAAKEPHAEHPKAVPETKLPQKVVSAAKEPHAEHPKAVAETKLPQKVVSAAKEPHAEHPKAVAETKLPQKVVSAAKEPHAEHPKAVAETKLPQKVVSAAKEPHATSKGPEIPKSTISWLTKGKAVALKTEESAPKVKVGSQSPELSKRAFTTSAVDRPRKTTGAPPRPKPPVLRTDLVPLTQAESDTKTAVEPILKPTKQPESLPLPSMDAKENGMEKSTSFEAPASAQYKDTRPVKPPRRKKIVPENGPREVEAVPKRLEPPPTAVSKREESPEQPSQEIPPKRPSIKPKRPAPPRPGHPPSFRVKGSPSKTRPPTTQSKSTCQGSD